MTRAMSAAHCGMCRECAGKCAEKCACRENCACRGNVQGNVQGNVPAERTVPAGKCAGKCAADGNVPAEIGKWAVEENKLQTEMCLRKCTCGNVLQMEVGCK